jgi:putative component of toxin-antitoxin plasmid stabilization module
VFQTKQTDEFRDWLARLRDIKARARIEARIDCSAKATQETRRLSALA